MVTKKFVNKIFHTSFFILSFQWDGQKQPFCNLFIITMQYISALLFLTKIFLYYTFYSDKSLLCINTLSLIFYRYLFCISKEPSSLMFGIMALFFYSTTLFFTIIDKLQLSFNVFLTSPKHFLFQKLNSHVQT